MDFWELCKRRYSVRDYSPRPVEREKLDYIMECVRLAPSAVNFQPWRFLLVSDEVGRAKVISCYPRDWVKTAPMFVVVCNDRTAEWVRRSDQMPHGRIDVAIATEHLCLAAAEQGLGTCWVCNFDVQKLSEAFALPESLEPVVIVPLGYPADEAIPEKQRKDLQQLLA